MVELGLSPLHLAPDSQIQGSLHSNMLWDFHLENEAFYLIVGLMETYTFSCYGYVSAQG